MKMVPINFQLLRGNRNNKSCISTNHDRNNKKTHECLWLAVCKKYMLWVLYCKEYHFEMYLIINKYGKLNYTCNFMNKSF